MHAEFMHVKPGKGAAFVRSKLKNVKTGSVIEKTFRAGESLSTADVMGRDVQFTYAEGSDVRTPIGLKSLPSNHQHSLLPVIIASHTSIHVPMFHCICPVIQSITRKYVQAAHPAHP